MHSYRLLVALFILVLFGQMVPSAFCEDTPSRDHEPPHEVVVDKSTSAGLVGLNVTNLGRIGHSFNRNTPQIPQCEYPLHSNVAHIYSAGIWVGAVKASGVRRVSTAAQDANGLDEGEELLEFDVADTNLIWSNSQQSDNYHIDALATEQFNFIFDDNKVTPNHEWLGIKVQLRALAWSSPYADDFVILDYRIWNITNDEETGEPGEELRDIYVGFWNDTMVGNIVRNNPYDDTGMPWNFYDDMNGAWGPVGQVPAQYTVPNDPDIWMMYEHDDDGDEGEATSWVGCRLLGTSDPVEPPQNQSPVSYNSWRFRQVPAEDDEYSDPANPDLVHPGKYQKMSNGAFTVGVIGETDYSAVGNWVGLLSTGPFPSLAPGDSLQVTYAIVCGADSLALLANSRVAQLAYDSGFELATGPPSPRLNFAYADDSVVLRWVPGDSLDSETGNPLPADSPLRSPEYHVSRATDKLDFQGYRIYRYQGSTISEDPYTLSTLVAQFDKIDGVGFDTGLPPINSDGLREYVDSELLSGFPYWYSVVSYSAEDLEFGLPEYQSGFNENSKLVYPGPGPTGSGSERGIGVYPNPYRAASMFDDRVGAQELGRKIWFTGLPARCTIQVFNLAGEVVKTLHHDEPSSGQHSWNVLSDYNRAIASGLYVYAVENLATGEIQHGKLVIIK